MNGLQVYSRRQVKKLPMLLGEALNYLVKDEVICLGMATAQSNSLNSE